MTQQNQASEGQPASQEEVLAYPFSLADHSLDLADPTIYERLQAECPVARIRMPFGREAVLLTRHTDVAKAYADPHVGTLKISDSDIPRRGQGRGPGTGMQIASIFSAADGIDLRRFRDGEHHLYQLRLHPAYPSRSAGTIVCVYG